jgi:hypothetical protein
MAASAAAGDEPAAVLRFDVRDSGGVVVPCRIHLFGPDDKPVKPAGYPSWNDHFVCDGRAELRVPPGAYRYEIERGPEHQRIAARVELAAGSAQTAAHALERIADLRQSGWYCGDVHVHRPVEDVPLLMRAEDLHVAPVITWWNQRNLWSDRETPDATLVEFDNGRFYDVMAGEDEREGGALLYFGLPRPIEITRATREYPSPLTYVAAGRAADPGLWIDIEKPFWWDVPVWLASGVAQSIGIANNHMCRSRMYENEAWGRPRNVERLPNPRGNGYWTQEIYYHALNCGLQLPPSAGSASGVLPNPVGYNRVYVHIDGALTWDAWWEGLRAGRSFVTNGPLLQCRANGEWPGHTFAVNRGSPLDVNLALDLVSLDHVPAVEVVHNGRVIETLPTRDARDQTLRASLSFAEPGWFLVRAITDRPETFRFASTAPYYVNFSDGPPRISRNSAEFFATWAQERAERVRKALADPEQARAVLPFHDDAIRYWRETADRANAE